jgi:hydrogenase nickel incorporation protein HypA/HybF
MHELSIASSILELARQHTPPGAVLRRISLRVGPMRGIEPLAMDLAWEATTQGTDAAGSKLVLELLPWRLKCPACGSEVTADDCFAVCKCGAGPGYPVGGNELQMVSIDVDEIEGRRQKDEG